MSRIIVESHVVNLSQDSLVEKAISGLSTTGLLKRRDELWNIVLKNAEENEKKGRDLRLTSDTIEVRVELKLVLAELVRRQSKKQTDDDEEEEGSSEDEKTWLNSWLELKPQ
jgi:small nuclear ribonucleoprotein (snRNP)-like protein